MPDITNPKLLYLKGGLFVVTGLFASALLLVEAPSFKVAALLAIGIWAFARAYYFAFYVVQHYADPGYRFAGLLDFSKYVWNRRGSQKNGGRKDPPAGKFRSIHAGKQWRYAIAHMGHRTGPNRSGASPR